MTKSGNVRKSHVTPAHSRAWRGLLVAVGMVAFGVGTAGLLLPILPTTPFYLVSGWCWLRGSTRLHGWLLAHPMFGAPLRDYYQHRGVRPRNRIIALVFLWSGLVISGTLSDTWHLRILLLLVGVAVTVHLSRLKTMGPDTEKAGMDAFAESNRINRTEEKPPAPPTMV